MFVFNQILSDVFTIHVPQKNGSVCMCSIADYHVPQTNNSCPLSWLSVSWEFLPFFKQPWFCLSVPGYSYQKTKMVWKQQIHPMGKTRQRTDHKAPLWRDYNKPHSLKSTDVRKSSQVTCSWMAVSHQEETVILFVALSSSSSTQTPPDSPLWSLLRRIECKCVPFSLNLCSLAIYTFWSF